MGVFDHLPRTWPDCHSNRRITLNCRPTPHHHHHHLINIITTTTMHRHTTPPHHHHHNPNRLSDSLEEEEGR
ncbi:hypothetical protein T439DRAFT_326979 [Meredithblackwellia eburnea MCA 4105]